MTTSRDHRADSGSPSTASSSSSGEDGTAQENTRRHAQETAEQRQDQAMQRERAEPSWVEEAVRREQGGHDRAVGNDHRPHPRPKPDLGSKR